MSELKIIRELTGLSQYKLAEWLGVSRGLISQAEYGKRDLPQQAFMKIAAMNLFLKLMNDSVATSQLEETEYSNPAKLALMHKKKMDFHKRSVKSLRLQLRKLKAIHPQIKSRLELLEIMKNKNTDWYTVTEQDKTWIEVIEWFSKERSTSTGIEEQELLKDKIEVHLAYAEIHKARWEKFSEIASVI